MRSRQGFSLGSFSLRFRRARVGRDPRTGTPPVLLPARYAVYFKPDKRLRERVDRESRGPAEALRHAGGSEVPHVHSGQCSEIDGRDAHWGTMSWQMTTNGARRQPGPPIQGLAGAPCRSGNEPVPGFCCTVPFQCQTRRGLSDSFTIRIRWDVPGGIS